MVLRRFLSVLVFVVILGAFPLVAMQAAAPATTIRSGAPADRGLVVRIYYSDPAELAALRRSIDVWAVYPDRGYVDAQVGAVEYLTLLTQGYRIEIDQARTTQLNLPAQRLPGQIEGIPGYACYRTVEETFTTAQNIANAHPDLAQWVDIGDSWEKLTAGGDPGYDLMVLKLTNQAVPGPKPKFFAMSSVHAREYAPAELNTRFAEYLISRYGVDPDVTWLLDYNEVQLLLQANPDGRKKAETGLLWRKNTNNNYCANSNSRGADLNRNYPFYWNSCAPGDGCSSSSACNEAYRGPSGASEPETQAVVNYVRSQYPDLRADDLGAAAPITTSGIFLDLHSYSELVLWPWGFTSNVSPNGTAMQTLGRKFAFFNNYTPQQAVGLYPTDGTTDDFAYGDLGVPAYTFEVGTDFFQDCTVFENTVAPNNLPAMVYALKVARRPYLAPAGPEVLNVSVTPATTIAGTFITLTASANDTRYRAGYGEPTQAIAAARYTLDAPSWITGVISYPLSAADGTFNFPIESLRAPIDTADWATGRHTIFVESQDTDGNWGPPTATFMWISLPLDKHFYLPIMLQEP
jgi:carboxypeptidase T